MSYAALHLHTEFSALDGLIPIKKLLPLIKAHGQTACAITDHGNLFGATDFVIEAKKHGITPILGVEQYLCADMADRTQRRNHHLILLAVTDEGWQNLKFLNSMSFMSGFYYVNRIDLALLSQYNTGIIGLSACLGGEIAQAFLGGGYARMREVALRYKAAFRPGCFFLEVQPNAIPEQESLNQALLRLESDIGVPLCATGDCHYLAQSDARAQDMLMAIQTRAKTGDENRLTHGAMNRLYVMHEDEMRAYFAPLGMEHAVDQAGSIGRCVDVTVTLGKPTLPKFPLPPGVDQRAYFRGQCERGLERRLRETKILTHSEAQYQARLEHEMSVIERMDFPGYFLIVAEFVAWAKDQGIPTSPGRGSGAGSLVAYSLRITDIDPLKFGLLFERFLNPERVSMPDFDVDFCERRREEVIAHIKERYGHKSVGQIATFGRLAGKSAIQAVAGAMGMDWRKAQDLTVGVPNVVEGHPPTVEWIMTNGKVLREKMAEDPSVKEIADMALSLQGSIKSRGVHASGVVIAPGPLWETVAVCADRTQPEEMVVQASMERTEDLGLIKFDVLGLTTTTVLWLCEKYTGVPMSTISFEDPHTYATIARGDTGGIFQMSGDGITRMLKDMAPTKFEHLSAAIALYRPGPLEGGMVKNYIDRMHGREKVEYLHPLLEETTKSTYGVLCVAKDQMVRTERGLVPIQTVTTSDRVQTESGAWNRVLATYERGIKPCVRVRMTNGQELVLTPDHRVLTNEGWKEAQNLQDHDLVMQFWASDEVIEDGDDKDWLVGLALADGDICATTPAICCGTEEFALKVKAIADPAWNLDCTISFHGRAWYVSCRSAVSRKNAFLNHLRDIGVHGLDCYTKRFPHRVSLAMAAGFFEGDGSALNNRLRVCNYNLAYRFWTILQARRIDSSFFLDTANVWTVGVNDRLPLRIKNYRASFMHGGYVPRPSLKFIPRSDNMRQHQSRKRPFIAKGTLRILEERYGRDLVPARPYGKIVNVAPCGDHETYDLTIENEHSFNVGGSIVHNCYQEQCMATVRALAGYSLGEADIVRRVMGKKKRELIEPERARFMLNAEKAGHCTKEKAAEIWDLLEKFAGYGFNLSHSVAYALLSYYTAWYKTNHRAAFYAAIASLAQSDTKKLAPLLHEIRASKITILPPDVNVALSDFTPVDAHTIRAGLLMLKGVGPAMVEKILAGRGEGPYKDIWDMGKRGRIPQGAMETLIKAGACDGIIPDRATALASAERATKKRTSQKSLFKDGPEYVKARPMDRKAMLAAEKEATGMFLSGHPLDHAHRPDNAVPISGLTDCEDGAEIKIRALCTNYEERATRSGPQMATVFFEDETGEIEAVCFPRDWAKIEDEVKTAFRKDLPLLAQVGVQVEISDTDEGEVRSVKLVLRKVMLMDEAAIEQAPDKTEVEKGPALHVTIPASRANDTDMALLLDRLMSAPGPLGVVLHLGEDRDTLDGLTVGERAIQVLSDLGYAVVKSNF